jgi:hypothetical protein
MTKNDRLVYLTLAYSAYFAFPLTLAEIKQRLVASDDLGHLFARRRMVVQKISLSRQQIKNSLKKLLQQGKISSDGEYYFLAASHLRARLSKQKYLAQKQQALQELVSYLQRIPLIKAAVLTGGTAVDNAAAADDLDMLIICRRHTLWIVRLWLVLLSKWRHKRPLRDQNAWCFNLFLDEDDLLIPFHRRSLYEAYEMLQMRFVYDPENLEARVRAVNQAWLGDYLQVFQEGENELESRNFESGVNWLNLLFFKAQKHYRQWRFGAEGFDLSPTQAFFNQTNFRERVEGYLRTQMAKLLKLV